ncbi:MAG: adenylyl-sulfate kinase [Promethearchaeota archaeon]
MHNKNFIVCLAGLPASGKTTFANKLKMFLERRLGKSKVKIIDPDKIRKSLISDKFNHREEPKVRKENLRAIEKEVQNGFIVISDDLNYYSSMRHDIKKIAEKFNISFFIIHIATPLEVCIKWNKLRGEPIPNKIVKEIHKKFDYFNKYYWDFPHAQYDLSQIKNMDKEVEELIEIFLKKRDIPQNGKKEEEYRKTISGIDNENLDKITRIYVGTLLKNPNYTHLKTEIIKLRKLFIKLNKNKSLKDLEILRVFRTYLEKNLNIRISE